MRSSAPCYYDISIQYRAQTEYFETGNTWVYYWSSFLFNYCSSVLLSLLLLPYLPACLPTTSSSLLRFPLRGGRGHPTVPKADRDQRPPAGRLFYTARLGQHRLLRINKVHRNDLLSRHCRVLKNRLSYRTSKASNNAPTLRSTLLHYDG